MRLNLKYFVATAAALVALSAGATPTVWDLVNDYQENTNPNGQWRYGTNHGVSFSLLDWNAGTSSYGEGNPGNTFIYRNDTGSRAYGIDPGKVSLEADWGTPDVRWTAPGTGTYVVSVRVGGGRDSGGGGYGNNFAEYAGVDLDGTPQSRTFDNNVAAWDFTAFLAAGDTVDVFVANPGFANGGNTQTDIRITTAASVPEPGSLALGLLSLASLAVIRRRRGAAPA